MEKPNLEILNTFTPDSMPDLDVCVLGALERFMDEEFPRIDASAYRHPLVVGSGNAEAVGRILFENSDAVFASESTYEDKLKSIDAIDGVVLVSASGAKHAPAIAADAKEAGKHVTLVTTTQASPAAAHADVECIFPKNREPYTYNTSTYLGMIFGKTGEDPRAIYDFINEHVRPEAFPDFSRYNKFYLIVPPSLSGIIRMLEVKFIELFGRRIARDIESSEYVAHATTVVPSEHECFISFGEENTVWGEPEHRLRIPLPEQTGYGAMMAVGYYVIGRIQKAHPPYFKEHIAEYTKRASEMFGQDIKPIVE